MPHDDFISNDLVNMRERLRRNYEEHQRSAAQGVVSEKNDDVPVVHAAVSTPLPVLKNEISGSENDRECRELEGRLLHDLAASRTLGEKLQNRVAENEAFHSCAATLLEELQQAIKERCANEQLYSLRTRYMSALGKWNVLCRTENAGGDCEHQQTAPMLPVKYWWFLIISLLFSALLIAGTLIALWG